MHLLPDPHKTKAKNAKDGCEAFRNYAAYVAVAAGTQGAVDYASVSAALAVASGWAAQVAGRIADDPPRFDFEQQVTRRQRNLRLDALRTDARTETGVKLTNALTHSNADLWSMLVATERAAGAILSARGEGPARTPTGEAQSYAVERRREAYLFGRAAGEDLLSNSELARIFAEMHRGRRPFVERDTLSRPQYTLADELPSDVLATLYRAGVPIGALRQRVRLPGADRVDYHEAITRMADTTENYGRYLIDEISDGSLLAIPG
jgi:hypothetical protein